MALVAPVGAFGAPAWRLAAARDGGVVTVPPTTVAGPTTPAAPVGAPTTLVPLPAPTTIPAPAIPTSSTTAPATAPTLAPPPGLPPAQAWTLVDMANGRVLDQSNEHRDLPPASLTKMLTAMIATANLAPGTLIPVSPRAANVEPDKVGMKAGELWPLDEALLALLIVSANDAAYAISEKVAGTAEAFTPLLDNASAQIGMADHPLYRDPAGLDDNLSIAGGNLVSARDLAISARDLLAEPGLAAMVPDQHLDITGPNGTVYHLDSHNRAFLGSYPGAIGVKTGYTVKAGVCIAAAATRAGRTMLAVVLHGVNPDQTATMLLDQGFATPAGAEPTADVLPSVRTVKAPSAAATASPPPGPAGGGSGGASSHLASAPGGADPVSILSPEGGGTLGALWPAPLAGALLVVVGGFAVRRVRFRRRPLAHGRR